MQVELSVRLVVDGTPFEYNYKLEDGKDADFAQLVQEARMRLCHKMKDKIDQVCK